MADTLIREGIAFQSSPLSPVPQYWAGTAYEKVQGANGGHRVLIFDASGVALLTASNPGKVDVQSALPAGTNNIGDIDVLTEPATAADGAAALPSVLKVVGGWDGTNVQVVKTDANGELQVDIVGSLPAGTNNIGDVDIASALPAGTNNIGDVDIASVPVVGAHANAWNAAAVSIDGVSSSIDTQHSAHISIFGNTSAASTITVQFSQNDTNFFDTETTISANGDFGTSITAGARFIRLKSSAAVTITATIAAKG